jgi:hypothetical protein
VKEKGNGFTTPSYQCGGRHGFSTISDSRRVGFTTADDESEPGNVLPDADTF